MKVFDKGPGEKVVIMDVREGMPQPFVATDWTDLRVGWFISATQAGADDTITSLAETIGTDPPVRTDLPEADRFFLGIGVKDVNFLGYTNRGPAGQYPGLSEGSSKILSSDSGTGTSNTNFWRIKNGTNDNWVLRILDGLTRTSNTGSVWQVHVPQNAGGAGGYATLVRLRYLRDNARDRAKYVTMQAIVNAADAVYTSTVDAASLENYLQAFPTTVTTLGPVQLSQEPTQLLWYWPWHNSRIRIHTAGILKVK